MPTLSYTSRLIQIVPETFWPIVFKAFLSNSLIWNRLQDEGILDKISDANINSLEDWSPGNLALLILGIPIDPEQKNKTRQFAIPAKLKQECQNEYSKRLEGSQGNDDPITFYTISMLALALYDRFIATNNMQKLISELDLEQPLWQSVLVCLSGLISNPENLLSMLFSNQASQGMKATGMQIVLCNPAELSDQAKRFLSAIETYPIQDKIEQLKSLKHFAAHLSSHAAQLALDELTSENSHKEQISSLQHQVELHLIREDHDQAAKTLEKAWQIAQEFQADLSAKLAEQAARAEETEIAKKALEHAEKLITNSERTKTNVIQAKFHTGTLDSKDLINLGGSENQNELATLISSARSAWKEQEFVICRDLSIQILDIVKANISLELTANLIPHVVSLLLDQQSFDQALALLLFAHQQDPTNTFVLINLSSLYRMIHQPSRSLDYANLAAALDPKNKLAKLELAKALAENKETEKAFSIFEDLITTNTTGLNFFLAYANTALKHGYIQTAVQISLKAIEYFPKNGMTHSLLAEAFFLIGDQENANHHLEKAISYHPELSQPWVILADQQINNKSIDVEEKLLAALHGVHEPYLIQAALGSLYKIKGDITRAVEYTTNAFEYISSRFDQFTEPQVQIAVDCASHLQSTGMFQKTSDILGKLESQNHLSTESKIKLANLYFQLGKYDQSEELALDLLTDEPDNIDAKLILVQISISLNKELPQARSLLEQILASHPEHPLALILSAEILTDLQECHFDALALYKKIFELKDQFSAALARRAVIGMATSALKSGKAEVAVAALQDHQSMNDPEIQQKLAAAYNQIGFHKESKQVLRELINSQSVQSSHLIWVANFCIEQDYKNIAEAVISELNKADRLSCLHILEIARIHLQIKQPSKASAWLKRILEDDQADADTLYEAGILISEIEDRDSGMPFIEKGHRLSKGTNKNIAVELIRNLLSTNDPIGANKIFEELVKLFPNEPQIYSICAQEFADSGFLEGALKIIEQGIDKHSEHGSLLRQAAHLKRLAGFLGEAIDHARTAIKYDNSTASKIILAEISRSMLDLNGAWEILESFSDIDLTHPNHILLKAECALQLSQDVVAADYCNLIVDRLDKHPRLLALQANLSAQMGQVETARAHLDQALKSLGMLKCGASESYVYTEICLSIAEAAIIQKAWDVAAFLTETALTNEENHPWAFYLRLKTIALRAEQHHFHTDANSTKHSPGDQALIDSELEIAKDLEHKIEHLAFPMVTIQLLNRWLFRVEMALGKNIVSSIIINILNDLPLEDHPAAMSALRRFDKEEIALEKFKNQRSSSDSLFQFALCLEKTDPVQALSLAYQASKKDPTNACGHAILARLAFQAGESQTALTAIQTALSHWEDEPLWLALAARCYQALGDRTNQLSYLEKAHELAPDLIPLKLALSKAYLADHAPGNAIRVLLEATQMKKSLPEIWHTLAIAYLKAEEYKEAMQSAHQWMKCLEDPQQAYLLKARICDAANEPQKALKYIEHAALLPNASTQTRSYYAQALAKSGQLEEAKTVLDSAIESASDPLPLLIEKAILNSKSNSESTLLENLIELSVNYPQEPQVFAHLSEAYINNGQIEEGIRAAQYALRFNTDQLSKGQLAQIHQRLGAALCQIGQLDQAIHHLTNAIQENPDQIENYLQLGLAYRKRRDHNHALDIFKQAITIFPKDARPLYEAGISLRDLKDFFGAESMFRRANNIDNKNTEIQKQLAAIVALNMVHEQSPVFEEENA